MDKKIPQENVCSSTTSSTSSPDVGFKRPIIFLAVLCIGLVGQSMTVNGALEVSISRIEKAFQYNSFHIAFINVAYNAGFCLSALYLGYLIPKNKMRWIGGGSLLISAGCLFFILPVFLMQDSEVYKENSNYLCHDKQQIKPGSFLETSFLYIFIMSFSYFLIGVGSACYYTLTISYIEEKVSKSQFGIYCSIYYSSSSLGPILSFVVYYFIIRIPFKFFIQKQILLKHTDENWIGAYWLIYVVAAGINFIISWPISLLNSSHCKSETDPTLDASVSSENLNVFELFRSCLNNLPFVFLCLAMHFKGLMTTSIILFITKYVESQFRLETSVAAVYTGCVAVAGATVGLLLGGVIVNKIDTNTKRLVQVIFSVSLLGVFALFFMLLRCPDMDIHGISISSATDYSFNTTCATNCHCNIQDYLPTCVNQEKTYYSPCSMGCKFQDNTNNLMTFRECTCLPKEYKTASITQGACKVDCGVFEAFMILSFISVVIEFVTSTPETTYTLYLLDRKTKIFGLSFQQILVRSSFMLGPLVFGKLLDLGCFLFNPRIADKRNSNCLLYDLKYISYIITLFVVSCKSISTIFIGLSLYNFSNKSGTNDSTVTT